MDVFSPSKIESMYQKYGITPPREFDSKKDKLEKQEELYKKQLLKMQKIISNFKVMVKA